MQLNYCKEFWGTFSASTLIRVNIGSVEPRDVELRHSAMVQETSLWSLMMTPFICRIGMWYSDAISLSFWLFQTLPTGGVDVTVVTCSVGLFERFFEQGHSAVCIQYHQRQCVTRRSDDVHGSSRSWLFYNHSSIIPQEVVVEIVWTSGFFLDETRR